MKSSLLFLFSFLGVQIAFAEERSFNWSNPLNFQYSYIIDNDGNTKETKELRDPCIIREGDTYYLVFTHWPFTHHTSKDENKPDYNSSPGIRMYSTRDFKNFTFENWLVKSSELPMRCPYKHRFWAPEIHKINGKYYLIFTADNWISEAYCPNKENGLYAFVGVATNITGPYEHITYIDGGACDTGLFQDEDGTVYAIMPKGNKQWIQEIDLSKLEQGEVKLLGEATCVLSNENPNHYPQDDMPGTVEGPWLVKRAGKYVLFSACNYPEGDSKGYFTEVAVSDALYGPYTAYHRVFPGGHIAVFTGPNDKDWFSVRGEKPGQAGFAELNISPIPFMDDLDNIQPFPLVAGEQTVTWEPSSITVATQNNPFFNSVNIDAERNINYVLPDQYKSAMLSIYDVQGRIVLNREIVGSGCIQTDSFPIGIYLLQLSVCGMNYTCKLNI